MIIFNIRWSPNLSMTFSVSERDKNFCDEFLTTMLPQDLLPLLHNGYHNIDTEDGFKRHWNFLQNHLEKFNLPVPAEISVRLK